MSFLVVDCSQGVHMNKKGKGYKTSCFAYIEKQGYCECSALIDIDCQNCKFYHSKEYYDRHIKPLKPKKSGGG